MNEILTTAIPVARPAVWGKEAEYLRQCVEGGQFSGGAFVARFEQAFADWLGVRHAIAVSSGTAALHLALLGLGIGPGDEVIVPDLTFVATANAVTYCGAWAIPVDVNSFTWTLRPDAVEKAITRRTKAILPVHLYGQPVDMDTLGDIVSRHGLYVVEDAAEALGSRWNGDPVGSLGHVGCFSFFGNKMITTGEGGMVVTNQDAVAERVRLLRGQGQDPLRRYWHEVVGYNYRMSEMQGAVGLAQVEQVERHLEARRRVRDWYVRHLHLEAESLQGTTPKAQPVFWMNAVLFSTEWERDRCALALAEQGVETRPVFTPLHMLPMYKRSGKMFLVADMVWQNGLVLPTYAGLEEEQVAGICREVRRWL